MREGKYLSSALLCLTVLAVLPTASCREPRRDPQTGRVRILYFGDAFAGPSPYPIYANDPLTTITAIRASAWHDPPDVIRKHMRTYMPRTEARLSEAYDMVVISDADVRSFSTEYFSWFRNAVMENGLGLVMVGGFETFGGAPPAGCPSWGDTLVQEVLPVRCLAMKWQDCSSAAQAGRLEINEWENPFIRSLPFGEIGPFGVFYGCNIVEPMHGASVLAYYRMAWQGKKHPLFCFWEVGTGASYAMTADWTPAGGVDFLRWPYYADYALNLAAYVTGGRLPDDLTLVHQVRRMMGDYRDLRQTLDGIIEFASKFGANMVPAERMIAEAQGRKIEADRSYVNGDTRRCADYLNAALDQLLSATRRAYKLKDEAMVWVYLTEWLVVASTGMVCAFMLWTLMVRRKAYREVLTTRLR